MLPGNLPRKTNPWNIKPDVFRQHLNKILFNFSSLYLWLHCMLCVLHFKRCILHIIYGPSFWPVIEVEFPTFSWPSWWILFYFIDRLFTILMSLLTLALTLLCVPTKGILTHIQRKSNIRILSVQITAWILEIPMVRCIPEASSHCSGQSQSQWPLYLVVTTISDGLVHGWQSTRTLWLTTPSTWMTALTPLLPCEPILTGMSHPLRPRTTSGFSCDL